MIDNTENSQRKNKIEDTEQSACTLCPRDCKKNRADGEIGVCGETAAMRIGRAALHMWEEPCISGEKGSGAVFFTGCPLHCVYCQNYAISDGGTGRQITVEALVQIFRDLEAQGAANINLVTADHFIPQVAQAIRQAKDQGFSLPFIYNTSSYVRVEALRMLDGLVDVYLPDMKYMDVDTAAKYSHAPDYPVVAKAAIAEMVRQCPRPVFDGDEAEDPIEEGLLMRQGVIVRHLLLPGCTRDSKAVIKYLYETYGNQIYLSIMNQYTPLENVSAYPELNRKVTDEEYEEVVDYAIGLGVEQGFIQEGETAEESFIPAFDGEGV